MEPVWVLMPGPYVHITLLVEARNENTIRMKFKIGK